MNKHTDIHTKVLTCTLLFHNYSVAIHKGKPCGALEDLFQGNGVKGKTFGLGSNMFEILPKYLETQSREDVI